MAMAKEKKQKQTDEPYKLSGEQLLSQFEANEVLHGCMSSDFALSGGIPLGSTIIIGGRPKAGKTTTALQYAAYGQNAYDCKVFFYDIEGRLTGKVLKQIRNLLSDPEHFEVIQPPPILDKDGSKIGVRKMPSEWWYNLIGDNVSNNPRTIHIVDSISKLSSEKEISERMGYQGRGDLQKSEAQFARLFLDLVMPNKCVVFLLAQIQANTSGYGPPLQIKCGNAFKHAADGIIFTKGFTKWDGGVDKNSAGHDIDFIVETSPMGPPLQIDVPLRYGYGLDDLKDIINFATNFGMLQCAGSWYTLPNGEKVQGELKLRQWLIENPEEKEKLETQIRLTLFNNNK